MNRDLRLTGSLRGQRDDPVAPVGFEVNNPWKVGLCNAPRDRTWLTFRTAREPHFMIESSHPRHNPGLRALYILGSFGIDGAGVSALHHNCCDRLVVPSLKTMRDVKVATAVCRSFPKTFTCMQWQGVLGCCPLRCRLFVPGCSV